MSWNAKGNEDSRVNAMNPMDEMDAELKQALGDFKASVHAWSEAEFVRPRAVHAATHRTLRLALGWSLAGVLLAAGTTGAVYEAHRLQQNKQENARKAAPVQAPTLQAQLKASPSQSAPKAAAAVLPEDDLMASVDMAVSRTVPSAMDPLADLTEESTTEK